ncbi:MAG: 30S ribosomal protein S12 methylthiotransferase RimO [Oscillospiraceae bacterium]|nr:30S ribosomal protein S12 methylthiotransferase RimO [Oscillospiraceae bacterium]
MIDKNKAGTAKIAMVSLGCPKNQCDAELMLAKIAKAGYRLVAEPGLADVVIINTCCFIQSAKEEAIEEILETASRKNDGINKKIIVTGCLSQRYKQQVADEFPEVDGVLGLGGNDNIVEAINTVLTDKKLALFGENDNGINHNMEGERLLSTMPHYAYMRIADGCDNRCSYCAIPLFRGGYRSRTIENIVEEARGLAENGVRELILVAQDVTNYGKDLYGKVELKKLLKKLTEIDKLKWIRLLYCYPQRITDELIEVIKSEPKIVKYLDLPIQHCNDEIIKAMNRTGGRKSLTELIKKLRNEIPGIILRTTLITGFPGETEEQFTELAEFAHEMRFEHLGCFAYSEEEGTAAAEFPDQIEQCERERRSEIIAEQQDVRTGEWTNGLIGREFEVVVEGFDKYAELYFGRSYMQAPEIDSMVYFALNPRETGNSKPKTGQFVNVQITEVVDNNLIGEIV